MQFLIAHTFWSRLRGMTGRKNTTIFFPNTKCVHGFTILRRVDLYWVDEEGSVIHTDTLYPFQLKCCPEAFGIVEVRSQNCRQVHDFKKRIKSCFFSEKSAQATVEMALILPLFLLIALGFLEIGRYITEKQQITHTVHYAAEVGSLTNDNLQINGIIQKYCPDCTQNIRSFDKNTQAEIPDNTRKYGDILTIQLQKKFALSIPLLSISEKTLIVEATLPILCNENDPPHTCP